MAYRYVSWVARWMQTAFIGRPLMIKQQHSQRVVAAGQI